MWFIGFMLAVIAFQLNDIAHLLKKSFMKQVELTDYEAKREAKARGANY